MKNIIRETVKEIEQQLHGTQEGFTPMEAQLVYNALEDFKAKIEGKMVRPKLQIGQKLYACLGWDEEGKKWNNFRIAEYEVVDGTNKRSLRLKVIEKGGYWFSTGFRYSDIGTRIFLSEEEARKNPLKQ